MNIIRVYNNEPTLFIDVSEVDAVVLGQATLAGGTTGIGAKAGNSGGTLAGEVEGVTAGIELQESPTIRYQPLQGQPLVAQISSPITVDSIAYLNDSDWHPSAIFEFIADRLTPDYREYGSALNAIIELDDLGALTMAPVKSDLTSRPTDGKKTTGVKAGSTIVQTNPPPTPGNDTLTLYLQPERVALTGQPPAATNRTVLHLWIRLLKIYDGTQPYSKTPLRLELNRLDGEVESAPLRVMGELDKLNLRQIELRTAPINSEQTGYHNRAPLLRTRSGYGILKAVSPYLNGRPEEPFPPQPAIAVIDPRTYELIRTCNENHDPTPHKDGLGTCWNDHKPYYTLLSTYVECLDNNNTYVRCDLPKPGQEEQLYADLDEWIKQSVVHNVDLHTFFDEKNRAENLSDTYDLEIENRLRSLRRFILIIRNNTLPANTYVAQQSGGYWYYISGNDIISQKNFILLAQILTMQAVAPGPPLTPTISVGGKGS
jgi:hypothetical protein